MSQDIDSEYKKLQRLCSIVMEFQLAIENKFDKSPQLKEKFNEAMTDEEFIRSETLKAVHSSHKMDKLAGNGNVKKHQPLVSI